MIEWLAPSTCDHGALGSSAARGGIQLMIVPAPVVQLDVLGLVIRKSWVWSLLGLATVFLGGTSWNFFYIILSLLLIQEGQLSVSDEKMWTNTGLQLRGKLTQEKCGYVNWLARNDPNGWPGCKISVQAINSWLYGASLHRAFHYHPSILSMT